MTGDRIESLESLLAKVKAANTLMRSSRFAPMSDDPDCIGWARAAYHGSLDAAEALHEAVLPGWGWRVGACYLSDDAFVFPDYNCPTHGARMLAQFPPLPDGREWADLTDIDQRPACNVARAWLQSILTALIAQERAKP